MKQHIYRRPGFVPLLFITTATALMLALSIWQVQRLAWKNALIAKIDAAMSAPVLEGLPADMSDPLSLEYRRVAIKGTYDYSKTLHFVGREPRGYYLLTPLALSDGRTVLVNRGWAEMDKLTIRDESGGNVAGIIRMPKAKRLFSPDNYPDKNVWFTEDLGLIAQRQYTELLPLIVEVTSPQNPGGMPIVSEGEAHVRNDHLGYAITWFLLACIGLIMFFFYHRKPLSESAPLLFITTGGTIDAEAYHGITPHKAVPLAHSLAKSNMKRLMSARSLHAGKDYDTLSWRAKDSKDFSEKDLEQLADIILQSASHRVIITHGTDRMVENARLLKSKVKDKGKTVILTGAMLPLADGPESDGPANLNLALRAADRMVKERPQGDVFIAFASQLFDPDHTVKNVAEKRFESSLAKKL